MKRAGFATVLLALSISAPSAQATGGGPCCGASVAARAPCAQVIDLACCGSVLAAKVPCTPAPAMPQSPLPRAAAAPAVERATRLPHLWSGLRTDQLALSSTVLLL